jgi:hypothetical protein
MIENVAIAVNHSNFLWIQDGFLVTSLPNFNSNNGLVQVWDYRNTSSPRIIARIEGNISESAV